MIFLFKWVISRFHVNFAGVIASTHQIVNYSTIHRKVSRIHRLSEKNVVFRVVGGAVSFSQADTSRKLRPGELIEVREWMRKDEKLGTPSWSVKPWKLVRLGPFFYQGWYRVGTSGMFWYTAFTRQFWLFLGDDFGAYLGAMSNKKVKHHF